VAPAAQLDLRTARDRVGDVPLDLLDRGVGDQGTLGDIGLVAGADGERGRLCLQAGDELVMDSGLYEDAVRADTGLSGRAQGRAPNLGAVVGRMASRVPPGS
jgi:hypothetical protein